MTQEGNTFACSLCGKEIEVKVEGKNPSAPSCCGQVMNLKE